jgi:hypothetical protein
LAGASKMPIHGTARGPILSHAGTMGNAYYPRGTAP